MPVATIHDVARLAGVGIGTVSRVINGNSSVKPETREKVLAAIKQLDYKPDPIARSMISKRTNAIGIIAPFFTRPFFMQVLQGVEAATARHGKELVLYNVRTDEQRDHCFSELPMRRKVDGVLILSLSPEDTFAQNFHRIGLPVVLVDAYSPLLTSLVVNNVEGAYQAIIHLMNLGHQRIGFINGVIEGKKFNQAIDRLRGVKQAFEDRGLHYAPDLTIATAWDRQGGREAAYQLLTRAPRPTALFVASDVQAIGALDAAKALHIRVPEELSIIGYDGIEISELLGLSTIQQPMYQMGEMGIEKLIEHINYPSKKPELIWLQPKLVERTTTGPLLSFDSTRLQDRPVQLQDR
jgi:DNA-binding LacI/PurR family transcriptional regulator